jgi:hypothetical protein
MEWKCMGQAILRLDSDRAMKEHPGLLHSRGGNMATAADTSESKIDIGRVISRGFATLGRQVGPLLLLSLLLSGLPIFITQYLLIDNVGVGATTGEDPAGALNMFSSPFYWLSILAMILGGYLLQAALVRSTILDQTGRPVDFGGSLGVALKLLLPMIGLAILSSLIIGFGFVLLIVPGVIAYLMLSVSVPVLVEERLGVIGSMGRSRALTKGSRLRILLLLILFMIVYIAVSALSGLVFFFLAQDSAFGAAFIAAITSAISALVLAVLLASLYIELRTVKEGASQDSLADIFA